jgi:hypothetical protein
MTEITSTPRTSSASVAGNGRSRSLRWGLPALAAAAAVSVIGVYGDHTLTASQGASQEAALPWIIGVLAVLGGLIFGLGIPRLLRGHSPSGWALAAGILGLATLAVYWSGLPVVLGTAALLLGTTGRRNASMQGNTAKLATAAAVIGTLAVGIDVVGTIVTYH